MSLLHPNYLEERRLSESKKLLDYGKLHDMKITLNNRYKSFLALFELTR